MSNEIQTLVTTVIIAPTCKQTKKKIFNKSIKNKNEELLP